MYSFSFNMLLTELKLITVYDLPVLLGLIIGMWPTKG